jgi:hypothetical protein
MVRGNELFIKAVPRAHLFARINRNGVGRGLGKNGKPEEAARCGDNDNADGVENFS